MLFIYTLAKSHMNLNIISQYLFKPVSRQILSGFQFLKRIDEQLLTTTGLTQYSRHIWRTMLNSTLFYFSHFLYELINELLKSQRQTCHQEKTVVSSKLI